MGDHTHMMAGIPPKHGASSLMEYLNRKSGNQGYTTSERNTPSQSGQACF